MLIKSYLNKIIPSNSIFNKYVIILTSGTILANIIQVLSLPLLTQIYSPDAYGSFGIFISITTILSICVTLKYENAIMNEKYLKNYINIYILCILICLSISLIYFFILITLDLFIPNLKILYSGYFLIPLMTFSMGINTAYLMLKNKKKEYKSIAILSTLQVLTIIIFQIIAGIYYSNSSIMLIIGRLLGFSLITLFGSYQCHSFYP